MWVTAGFDFDAFWRKTLRTINIELAGRMAAFKREEADRARWVWHTARLQIIDPKLFPRSPAALLPKEKTIQRQDWKAMEAGALAWTVNVGGTVLH
ncbi:MAG: hypothetical protein ACJAVC_000568 [Brevundimonas sp.]